MRMMKNLLLLFALLLTAGLASAQLSIEIDPPTIHGQGGVNEQDIEVHVTVTNTSDTKVDLLWTRYETDTSCLAAGFASLPKSPPTEKTSGVKYFLCSCNDEE